MTQNLRPLCSPEELRHDWRAGEIEALFAQPFNDLLFQAQSFHRRWFPANAVQRCTLLSIKTGGCPEDCGYCSQSAKFGTGIKAEKLMDCEAVLTDAAEARRGGATRYCMGAAWRNIKDRDLPALCRMIEGVRKQGMETCMTLGMLTAGQAARLAQAGLDYYNHNLDTSPEYYSKIVSTRSYEDRLETLAHVRAAGINVCCGGILGMGEARADRIELLRALANLPAHPQSVPINMLIAIPGTPLEASRLEDPFEFIRMIAAARIMMPQSVVRLAAGRESMSDEFQALCFLAGANSLFIGARLLTARNPEKSKDDRLFERLGLDDLPADFCPSALGRGAAA